MRLSISYFRFFSLIPCYKQLVFHLWGTAGVSHPVQHLLETIGWDNQGIWAVLFPICRWYTASSQYTIGSQGGSGTPEPVFGGSNELDGGKKIWSWILISWRYHCWGLVQLWETELRLAVVVLTPKPCIRNLGILLYSGLLFHEQISTKLEKCLKGAYLYTFAIQGQWFLPLPSLSQYLLTNW